MKKKVSTDSGKMAYATEVPEKTCKNYPYQENNFQFILMMQSKHQFCKMYVFL